MKKSRRNEFLYDIYSFFYNPLIFSINHIRKKGLAKLQLEDDHKILIPGCGTGSDFPYLPEKAIVYAVDLSQGMLNKAKAKAKQMGRNIFFCKSDAAHVPLKKNQMDWVMLHLILSVTDRPKETMDEAIRVVHPGGYISVFDKFAPDEGEFGLMRRLMRPIFKLLGTDIAVRLQDITQGKPLVKESETSCLFGQFKWVVFRVTLSVDEVKNLKFSGENEEE